MYELASWRDERRSAHLYRILSDLESGTPRQLLFLELAKDADDQAAIWAHKIQDTSGDLPAYRPGLRVKTVVWLARRLGPRRIKLVLAAMKVRGLSVYSGLSPGSYLMPVAVDDVGTSHRGTSDSMRAAAFSINDGLVSIALLVMGVAGATRESSTVMLAGVAGLLAGAYAMAAGEYISMRAQREMVEYQAGLERDGPAQYPRQEAKELALIYRARGMDKDEAQVLANRMLADPEMGQDRLTREERGLNPEQLGSPWQAAIFSFFAFILGGAIPLLPFVVGVQRHPLLVSMALSCAVLFSMGAVLSLFTGRQALWSGLRVLLIGILAGAVTYFVGKFLGARIS